MKLKKILLWVLLLMTIWVATDLFVPRKNSLRDFNPTAVGQLDAAMWCSYYERKRGRLFFQLSKLMREQFHAPFWRSFPMAYQAAKAAVVFQDGRNRDEYSAALPFLEKYFTNINQLSDRPFDVGTVAKNELEWWIIRREPQYSHADWEQVLAGVSAELYHIPKEQLVGYAQLRVEAMAIRDSLGKDITNDGWQKITALLVSSWTALHEAVQEN